MPDTTKELYLRNKAELLSWGYTELSPGEARAMMYGFLPQRYNHFIFISMFKTHLDIFADELKASLVEEKMVKSFQRDKVILINNIQLNFWFNRNMDRFRGLDRVRTALVFLEQV